MLHASLLRSGLLLGVFILLGPRPATAGLVFYTSQAAFDAAAPTLLTQTFSSAVISNGLYATMANPLNSSTSNGVFSAGSILPGMNMLSSSEHSGKDIDAVASGLFGNTAKALYNDYGGDSLNTTFTTPETAVGMWLLNPNGSSVTFGVDSPAGTLLGSQVVTVNDAGPSVFFGVIATGGTQVGQIQLLGQASSGGATHDFAGMDQIVFGVQPQAVPEGSSVVLLASGLAIAAVASRRGRLARLATHP